MSLPHALLTALIEHPGSGLELASRFDRSIGYFWQAVVARLVPGGAPQLLANAGTVSDTLCSFTDGALAGRVPPYPEGAWAASSF